MADDDNTKVDQPTGVPAAALIAFDELRTELRSELRREIETLRSEISRGFNHLLTVVPAMSTHAEVLPDDIGQVQCQNPGCGTLLMDGACPRCSHPRAAPPVPRHPRGQCKTPGCGCVLDERGLCPRCYPAPPPIEA